MERQEAVQFRLKLLELRASLEAEGAAPVAVEERADSKLDEDEQPLKEMGQVIASNRNRERAVRLQAIEGALRRLEADPEAFGECTGCGELIAERRLLLMPWVVLCVGCQSGQEEGRRGYTRKKVTDLG
jgi:DnaK suppressor protein